MTDDEQFSDAGFVCICIGETREQYDTRNKARLAEKFNFNVQTTNTETPP